MCESTHYICEKIPIACDENRIWVSIMPILTRELRKWNRNRSFWRGSTFEGWKRKIQGRSPGEHPAADKHPKAAAISDAGVSFWTSETELLSRQASEPREYSNYYSTACLASTRFATVPRRQTCGRKCSPGFPDRIIFWNKNSPSMLSNLYQFDLSSEFTKQG